MTPSRNPHDPPIEVRAACAGDESGARGVEAAAFERLRSIYRPSTASRQSRTHREGDLHWVATLNGDCVATLRGFASGQVLDLFALAVHPRHQGYGLARRLMEFAENEAHRTGCSTLRLKTVLEAGVVPVFERLGFTAQETFPDPSYETGSHAQVHSVVMVRRIAP